MNKNKTKYNYPVDLIKKDNKSRIHLFTVHLPGAKKIGLQFGDIHLPAGSYVELADKARNYVYTYVFDGLTESSLAILSDTVSIKVVLPKSFKSDEKPSLKLISAESLSLIDEDTLHKLPNLNWEAYKCYAGTDIGVYALSSALCGATEIRVDGSSCSLIGAGNFVLTNKHVLWEDNQLQNDEIWLNYVNESCDLNSKPVEPVRISTKGGKILKKGASGGGGPGSGIDYSLFTVNEFDYRNAHVKRLFGGLKIADNNAALGDTVYEPHYGASHPMIISANDKDHNRCRITEVINPPDFYCITNCEIVGGASGSPILSRENNELVGLCSLIVPFSLGSDEGIKETGGFSEGINARILRKELDDILGEDNVAVKPEGKVTSWNVEVSPVGYATVYVDLGKQGRMLPFDTVIVEDFDDYSIIEVESLDLTSDEINNIKFRVEVETEDGITNLSDESLSGEVAVHIKPYEEEWQRVEQTVSRSWFPLRVEDKKGKTVANHLIRIAYSIFDPFEIPFDSEDAVLMDFVIDPNEITSVRKKIVDPVTKVSCFYTALYTGEGPQAWDEYEYPEEGDYSVVKTMLKNEEGDTVNINLRGQRLLKNCDGKDRITIMNHMIPCDDAAASSSLILSYYPEDNPNVDLEDGFSGVIPLDGVARDESGSNHIKILVRLTLTDDSAA